MDERPVDVKDRLGLAIAGLMSLVVGLMLFVPGIFFLKSIVLRFMQDNQLPEGPFVFITAFILAIGLILLLLSYQFFTGKVSKQHLSTPLLAIVSAGFVATSIIIALSAYVFKSSPTGNQIGRAIGGSMAAGCLGLYFAYKRVRGASNQRSDHDRAYGRPSGQAPHR